VLKIAGGIVLGYVFLGLLQAVTRALVDVLGSYESWRRERAQRARQQAPPPRWTPEQERQIIRVVILLAVLVFVVAVLSDLSQSRALAGR
jgi:hypothetical protein